MAICGTWQLVIISPLGAPIAVATSPALAWGSRAPAEAVHDVRESKALWRRSDIPGQSRQMSADKPRRGNEQLAQAPISFRSRPGTSPRHRQVRGRAP